MSSIYVLEPPTKGKVIVNTSYGPIDIELWPKEAPKAVRNFVQLCLESYFDNTVFHRIVRGFLVQGGDATGTGTGGESIYGGVFSDEFHSRLRFNHRGIVAMANANSPNSNGSQFFMTLDKCEWLDKKHTIFGKVTGDSIFNLLRIGEVDTGDDDRPLDPMPKILSVEVLWNPFEDIVPRVSTKALEGTAADDSKEPKRKAVKKLNLLSFGEEAEEEEKELAANKQKIKSSHDVLNDPRLLKSEDSSIERNADEEKARKELQLSVKETLSSKKEGSQKSKGTGFYDSLDHSGDEEDEATFDLKMRRQVLHRRNELGDMPSKPHQKNGKSGQKGSKISVQRTDAERIDDDGPKVEKLSIRKKGLGSEARAERNANADTDLQLHNESERARLLQKLKKRRLHGREDDVLAKLEKFKQSFSAKSAASSNESGVGKDELNDWQKAQLKFDPEQGKNHMSRKEDANDYVVHDPLLEKGKEKFNRIIAKQRRGQREWAGKSLD